MTSPVSQANTKFILEAIEKLRSCVRVNNLSSWQCLEADLSVADISTCDFSLWSLAQLNAKGHIGWVLGQNVLWLVQKVVIPQDLQGYPLQGLSLRLSLVWWADSAQVYVNGKLTVEGDLFDSSPRVLLSDAVTPADEFIIALRLVSPGHCDGALVKSLLIYESTDENRPDPGFVADELAVMQRFLETFEPQRLEDLAGSVAGIDWEETNRPSGSPVPQTPAETLRERDGSRQDGGWTHQDAKDAKEDKKEFEKLLFALRQRLLESKIQNLDSKIYLLGHAHLDLAWLWPVSETWKAAQSTFESVLKLQQDFPELIFCHSSPVLYAWIEEHRPDLFDAIQEAVKAGRWEVVGGFWVEPELNLIAGESIVRQLLYGQRYVLEKFGKLSSVVWVPDSFGFCATLPQFFASAGVEYFVTQKLRWNDTTKFDYGAFWWRSPDGSEVFSYMSALVGEGIDPVKMASYACEWQTQTGLSDALWLPGVGDHGGGPTRDMLETAQRWQKSSLFPKLEFTTAENYLQQIKNRQENNSPPASPASPPSFPTWEDELYLEFHRGCYTTHADQKRWNRRCEGLLYQAELFAALATISSGVTYPKAELEAAWKKVLFNQFHDILPGSSINQVYADALPTWQEVEKVGNEILQESLSDLASQINLSEPPQPDAVPIFVFNSLNWQRSSVVAVELPLPHSCVCVYNLEGELLPSQLSNDSKLLFIATDVPSVGYRVFWLCPQLPKKGNNITQSDDTNSSLQKQEHFERKRLSFENEFLRVTVDEETGNLSSLFDKVNDREVLSCAGNQLQAFQDSGQYWDAWNIDPNYSEHPLPPTQLKSIEWLETGLVQTRLRVVRQLGESEFCCDYILQGRSPILKIVTTVNWQERNCLVKAAFPLNLEADFATYEIPCGTIRRPTKPETPAEKAKWEVPALRWADLTTPATVNNDHTYGVSLLNDCKYGYDSQSNQLRLSLLRSPNWPDEEADKGFHEFTYALYPHAGSWESAHTVRHGYELHLPMELMMLSSKHHQNNKSLPPVGSFLDLSAENLILMAFKQAEDNPKQWIVRCYECHGQTADLQLQSDLGLTLGESVDLLEHSLPTPEFSSGQQIFTIQPWKISSFRVS
ncbi:alpha-mannosidase [Brasilonema octagenarum UFV-E1]|uniref:Alpha-mannosidase n=1 Tax=Brasilonema sennae CENA114 TaxID=415709 RepID=A0A856MJ09_9CYAN|nr:alpha-mannosidase [Brasilonema sennae]QDL11355.1 alpha-mannosidase [Brasilonema sennae CENA114]QDL17696.1 alpha-mannosidase [Brasilonema octagenarum UFV-E1]